MSFLVDWARDWSQQIHSAALPRRISDKQYKAWNVQQTDSLTEQGNTKAWIRRTKMNSNPHTFLFICFCMQQASKARAEQRSLMIRLNSLCAFVSQCIASAFTCWGGSYWKSQHKTLVMARVCSKTASSTFPLLWLTTRGGQWQGKMTLVQVWRIE